METRNIARLFDERQRLITVDEFNKMAEANIFSPEEQIELIDGLLMTVPRISALRASVIMRMWYRLSAVLGRRAFVAVRPYLILSDVCEPQADLGVLAWKEDFYRTGTPRTSDIIAVVDIADELPAFSRERKVPIYAKAQVAECWVVDVISSHIEIYRRTENTDFDSPRVRSEGEQIAFSAFPKAMFTVNELLG